MSNRDEFFLKKTLKLAKLGIGWTHPNPMVGALVVKDGKVIGKGYHRRIGVAHAEIEALRSAKDARGSTLYVNLEPCDHYGRTPPCTKAIVKAGIARVVCSTLDPNPRVHGKGVARLRRAGIRTSIGGLREEARRLNEAFFAYHEKKRPFVALKFAASLDGKMATKTGDSKWITGHEARKYAREIRGQYQAVLVGINTVIKDNPHLGIRVRGRKDPLRIILDSRLRTPLESKVLRDNNVLIATTSVANKQKMKILQRKGISFLSFDSPRVPLRDLLKELAKQEVISVFVEGGRETLESFLQEKIADKVYVFFAPLLIGNAVKIREGVGLRDLSLKSLGEDFLISGYLREVDR